MRPERKNYTRLLSHTCIRILSLRIPDTAKRADAREQMSGALTAIMPIKYVHRSYPLSRYQRELRVRKRRVPSEERRNKGGWSRGVNDKNSVCEAMDREEKIESGKKFGAIFRLLRR